MLRQVALVTRNSLQGVAVLLITAMTAFAEDASPDPWGPLRLLEGNWRGVVVGKLGEGSGVRRYRFLFGDTYLLTQHSSVRLPQEKGTEGDNHRELTIYSYDSERRTVVLREFNVEGYVLEYDCDVTERKVACNSTRIESGANMRARMTLDIKDAYSFDERFELATPGEELTYYLTVHWVREPHIDD